ncbi:uncharacterized protein LOC113323916 [Papaver somniferum]|uniref:uncharacterized protein LOC113323916 n=1 Tax=Papaver somniferum TaxID=3469 RepID=UPI000E70485E|nr:uncharacterized protein LOC113323916 [Papaver somniferum]
MGRLPVAFTLTSGSFDIFLVVRSREDKGNRLVVEINGESLIKLGIILLRNTLRSCRNRVSGLSMAYIPPHKRQSKDNDNSHPIPTPFFLLPRFKEKSNLGSSATGPKSKMKNDTARKGGIIIYAKDSISKWFIECGSATSDGDELPAKSFRMEPFPLVKSLQWKRSGEPFVLASNSIGHGGFVQTTPWRINEFRRGWCSTEAYFHSQNRQNPFSWKEIFRRCNQPMADAEMAFGRVGRSFWTNLPDSYMEAILATVIPKIRVDSEHTKEYYHVKKRCLRVDVSCLDRDLDLRLMLSTKRGLTTSVKGDPEKLSTLRQLVDGAILDSNVQGGLKWDVGKR